MLHSAAAAATLGAGILIGQAGLLPGRSDGISWAEAYVRTLGIAVPIFIALWGLGMLVLVAAGWKMTGELRDGLERPGLGEKDGPLVRTDGQGR